MRKGQGRAAQIRGHKRCIKYKNHLLGRNPRDGKENEGSYNKWYYETLKKSVGYETSDQSPKMLVSEVMEKLVEKANNENKSKSSQVNTVKPQVHRRKSGSA